MVRQQFLDSGSMDGYLHNEVDSDSMQARLTSPQPRTETFGGANFYNQQLLNSREIFSESRDEFAVKGPILQRAQLDSLKLQLDMSQTNRSM